MILGSDCRARVEEASADIRAQQLMQELIALDAQWQQETKNSVKSIASLLNTLFQTGQAKIVNQRLEVTKATLGSVKQLFEKPDALQHSLKKLDAEKDELIRETAESPEIAKSNAQLSQLFQKVATQYSKVIAVWGYAHFVVGKELFKRLDQAKISYVILMPNAAFQQRIQKEREWQLGEFATLTLPLATVNWDNGVKRQVKTASFPLAEECCGEFVPAIRQVLRKETKRQSHPLIFNPQQLFKDILCDHYTLPENTPIHFNVVPLADFLAIADCERTRTKLEHDALVRNICNILSLALLLNQKKLSYFGTEGEMTLSVKYIDLKPIVVYQSNKPTVIRWRKDCLFVEMGTLLEEMDRHQLKSLNILPGQQIVINDVSIAEVDALCKDPGQFLYWLHTKAPPEKKVSLDGQGTIVLNELVITSKDEKIEDKCSLLITNEGGFSILLEPI